MATASLNRASPAVGAASDDRLEINGVQLHYTGRTRSIEGQTASRDYSTGTAHIFNVALRGRSRLQLAEVLWDNGDWDVRCVNAHRAPKRFHRLCHGLRLGVHQARAELNSIELRIARPNGKGWPTACLASVSDLRGALGTDPRRFFRRLGAVGFGTRAELLDDWGHAAATCARRLKARTPSSLLPPTSQHACFQSPPCPLPHSATGNDPGALNPGNGGTAQA